MALNIEHDTRPNPKNRIPKPPKVVHDDVTVVVQSRFWSHFSLKGVKEGFFVERKAKNLIP